MSGNRAIEWRHFWAFYNGKGRFTVKPLQQMRGDLFNVDDDFSLAHCVSSDLKMSQGIALQFRCRFGRLRELRNQNKIPGEMAYLRHGDKFIYYLVTKHRYFQKPSYKNIWQCLWYMKEHIVCNGVRRLGLPKIACGRDGKDWGIIKSMIEFIFRDVPCDIFVKKKMTNNIQAEDIWLTKNIYEDAESAHYEGLAKAALTPLAGEVAKARQHLIKSRDTFTSTVPSIDTGAIKFIEKKVVEFEKSINDILHQLKSLDSRISDIETSLSRAKPIHEINVATAHKQAPVRDDDDEDDGVDLFASDSEEENETAARIREERLAAYAAKKSQKPALIAKSNVILDVKPWDDETDMKALEEHVRKIETNGLLWGAAKLVPLAYGIHKLQISCVVEDDKVSIDWLTEQLEAIEEYVQSVDIAAFNKI